MTVPTSSPTEGRPSPTATPTTTATVNPFGSAIAFRSAVEIRNVAATLTGIAVGSLDPSRGNAFVDLLVTDRSSGGVRWLEGRGTGAFQPRTLSTLAGKPEGLSLADLNGDGILDVSTFDRESGEVLVAFGNGDGTFRDSVSTSIGGDLRGIVTADSFVVVADAAANQVVICEVEAGPVLSVIDSIGVGAEPVALATGDFDGNGLTDVAVGSRTGGNVTLLRQGGGRVFSPVATLSVGTGVSAAALGDVNADGTLDLLVTHETGELVVLRNDARRTFTRVFTGQVGIHPVALRVVDDRSVGQVVTGDGRADALVLDRGANDVLVLGGLGDGRFEVSSRLVVGNDPVGLAVGDFDEDQQGAVDFATANQGSGSLSVVRGQGGGSFVAAASFGTGPNPVAFTIADFDRDGWLDVVTLNRGDGTVSFLRGNGRGSLKPRQDFAARAGATLLASGDFDGDGFVDLAAAAPDDSRITILPNGISGFGLAKTVNAEVAVAVLLARDLDFDGRADLVALQPTVGRVLVLRSAGANFDAPRVVEFVGTATTIGLAQVLRDANVDLVVGVGEPASLLVFEGLGGGDFRQVGAATLPSAPAYLAVDDFIPDGVPDVAVLSSGAGRLYLLRGDGTGNWTRVTDEGVIPGSSGLAAADLNGNGIADLVLCDPQRSTVTAFSGDGAGRFAEFAFPVGKGPIDVAVANLNVVSDATGGLAEVVSLNAEANTVTVLRNISRATAPPATATPTVGPGTPPPPEPPTPLPTRTRRPAASKQGKGCAVVGDSRDRGAWWTMVPLAVIAVLRWRAR